MSVKTVLIDGHSRFNGDDDGIISSIQNEKKSFEQQKYDKQKKWINDSAYNWTQMRINNFQNHDHCNQLLNINFIVRNIIIDPGKESTNDCEFCSTFKQDGGEVCWWLIELHPTFLVTNLVSNLDDGEWRFCVKREKAD